MRDRSDDARTMSKRSTMELKQYVGSILHGVDPLSYPVYVLSCLWDGAYKITLLLIDKSSLCGGSGFPFSLSEWSLTICLTPYNRR